MPSPTDQAPAPGKNMALRQSLLMVSVLLGLALGARGCQAIRFRQVTSAIEKISLDRGPRFSHQQVQNLPAVARTFLKTHIAEGTPLHRGARFHILGSHRSDLSNPWLSFSGQFSLLGNKAYLWDSTVSMGALPVHHYDFLLPGSWGSRTLLMGLLPLDSRKGPGAMKSNRERLVLESVLVPTLLVPPSNKVLWRTEKDGSAAYSIPDLAPGKWVQIRVDRQGHLIQASISRLADFLAPDKARHYPYSLKTLGFPRTSDGILLPSAVALGWHQVYEEQELPYPDLEKPQPDGFAEMVRYKINETHWLPEAKSP